MPALISIYGELFFLLIVPRLYGLSSASRAMTKFNLGSGADSNQSLCCV